MLLVTKGRMFIPAPEIQEIASTTNFHHNRNSKNLKVLLFVKFVTNHLALDCWNRLDYSYQSEKIPQALAVLALNEEDKDPNFYVDSRAKTHITNDLGKITQVIPYKGHDPIFVGNREAVRISHIGEARLKTKHRDLKLKKLLVTTEIKKNLLSIG